MENNEWKPISIIHTSICKWFNHGQEDHIRKFNLLPEIWIWKKYTETIKDNIIYYQLDRPLMHPECKELQYQTIMAWGSSIKECSKTGWIVVISYYIWLSSLPNLNEVKVTHDRNSIKLPAFLLSPSIDSLTTAPQGCQSSPEMFFSRASLKRTSSARTRMKKGTQLCLLRAWLLEPWRVNIPSREWQRQVHSNSSNQI